MLKIRNEKRTKTFKRKSPTEFQFLIDDGMQKVETIQNNEYWNNYAKAENPTWVSMGEAETRTGVRTDLIKRAVEEGMINVNTNLESSNYKNPYVSLEDVVKLSKSMSLWEEGMRAKLSKKINLDDKDRYLLANLQNYRMRQGLNKTQTNYMWKLFTDYFSDEYVIVPKNLSLEEQINVLREQRVKYETKKS